MPTDTNNENRQNEQQGSGSAENKGESREHQKAKHATLDDDERKDIADQTRLRREDIADVQQTGALSGRDDAAGGTGDDMTSTSSNQPTEKF